MSDTHPSSAAADSSYPGERIGLPPAGPGAVAGWPRRFAALALDWIASMLTVAAFIGTDVWTGRDPVAQWGPLSVFLLEGTVLTALLGGSFGQLLMRVAVVRIDGRPLTVLHTFVRTFLICLVFPPLIFNRDQRGLHDFAVRTVTVRR